MQITIVGTGYVGLVTGVCFAELGNFVTCVDLDARKIATLERGEVPIHEPGLDELLQRNISEQRISFATDMAESLQRSEIVFLAVGTPPNEDGSADISHVLAAAREIGAKMAAPLVIANKSTVPVGTADNVRVVIQEELEKRGREIEFDVVSNPEFLREGNAVQDFMYPDRIVVGAQSTEGKRAMERLYGAFGKQRERLQFVGIRDAEMIKYAANAMLATKISFMNEVALMCDHYGVDVECVRRGIGSDPRIGPSFIYAGCGFGGSCFPKDVRAMIQMATAVGVDARILSAVEARNNVQKRVLVDKIVAYYGDLDGKTFAIWGLAFKPNTDDIREAPALTIVEGLLDLGASVRLYDPEAMPAFRAHCERQRPGETRIRFAADEYDAATGADGLVVVTEWRQFKQPDFERLAGLLQDRLVFDGRNIYGPAPLGDYGLRYIGIGRGHDVDGLAG